MPSNQTLRAVTNRSNFDRGKDLAQRTSIEQCKFIAEHFSILKQIDTKSRPSGWKTKKFRECSDKINRREPLSDIDMSFLDSIYEAVIGKVFNVPSYKNEFYKGHKR
jgi:hypothetical protein